MSLREQLRRLPRGVWLRAAAAVVSVAILLAAFRTYAWFYNRRTLQLVAQVSAPTTLYIRGGQQTDIQQIDLSNVDLNGAEQTADFVFCVTGTGSEKYEIELAHTTNIEFAYEIYPTEEKTELPASDHYATYTPPDGGSPTYYVIDAGQKLTMTYINATDQTPTLANDSQHQATYGTYDSKYVQKNAEPLYKLSDPIRPTTSEGNTFCDYYVLEIKWNSTDKENLKETDLVYILAANA